MSSSELHFFTHLQLSKSSTDICSDREVLKRQGVFHSIFYLSIGAMSFQFEGKG